MSLLQMSFSGAVMIGVIALIRALTIHRLPKKTFLALWGVALVRLLVPYSLPAACSVYSLAGGWHTPSGTGSPGTGAVAVQRPVTVFPAPGANIAAPTVDTASHGIDPWIVVWAAGALACAAFFAVAYWKCRREFRESLPVENGFAKNWLASHKLRRAVEIRQSDKISAPLTYGVFRPVILMPKNTHWNDSDSLKYVLAHEYVHIRRFDAAAKLALTLAFCVHWFNPMVWVMYVLANRDMELSCDEAVVRRFGEDAKSAYALTLIRMEETKSGLAALGSGFSKNAVEERIVAIMKMKKITVAALLAAVVMVAGVMALFATSAAAPEDPVETLVDSLRYADGTVSFQAPLNMEAGAINVRVYGRAEYDDGFSRSIHALDDVEILPGETYSVAYDPAYTEWGMEILYQEQSRTVDLLSLVEAQAETASSDSTLMSYVGPGDGKTYYSWDNGATWTPLTDEEFEELYPNLDIEWWTVEEYEAWLEQEKADLQSIIGNKGWNPTEGWYTWTQEKVDETIARYEQTRKDIQGGMKISKPTQDGDTMIQFGYDPRGIETVAETGEVYVSADSAAQELSPERLAEYEAFGLTCDKSILYWNGKLVDVLVDYAPDGGYRTVSSTEKGGIRLQTVYDSSGKLTGVEEIAA